MSNEHIGRTETRTDRVRPGLLQRLAATLGVPVPDALPPLWHWALFQDWALPEGLGPDGHPRRGGFLPDPAGLPRRMWAGGHVRLLDALQPGDPVQRTSTVRSVEEKQGASGRLVFVTVRHEVAGPRGPALEERQDLVYRSADGPAVKPAPAAPPPPSGAPAREVLPDPVLLFRYSALTGNGHRIHYDADYARDVEGYPGLVVHGPLQATWMAALAEASWGPLRAFRFRGLRPAFAGRPLRIEGWRGGGWEGGGDAVTLRTRDDAGAACMEAAAELA